ncbi:hypothetical protein NDU88_006700 [Pleurodeles waltl]|uniref:Uncharacterized protein n=1 Tax=Pleurodeles waltl TaxID=8319 RepID=A0AAV7LPX8_PLEWA|nr:hypothetical protein NDU88_006700 [Pleurodeles waltl]
MPGNPLRGCSRSGTAPLVIPTCAGITCNDRKDESIEEKTRARHLGRSLSAAAACSTPPGRLSNSDVLHYIGQQVALPHNSAFLLQSRSQIFPVTRPAAASVYSQAD